MRECRQIFPKARLGVPKLERGVSGEGWALKSKNLQDKAQAEVFSPLLKPLKTPGLNCNPKTAPSAPIFLPEWSFCLEFCPTYLALCAFLHRCSAFWASFGSVPCLMEDTKACQGEWRLEEEREKGDGWLGRINVQTLDMSGLLFLWKSIVILLRFGFSVTLLILWLGGAGVFGST